MWRGRFRRPARKKEEGQDADAMLPSPCAGPLCAAPALPPWRSQPTSTRGALANSARSDIQNALSTGSPPPALLRTWYIVWGIGLAGEWVQSFAYVALQHVRKALSHLGFLRSGATVVLHLQAPAVHNYRLLGTGTKQGPFVCVGDRSEAKHLVLVRCFARRWRHCRLLLADLAYHLRGTVAWAEDLAFVNISRFRRRTGRVISWAVRFGGYWK